MNLSVRNRIVIALSLVLAASRTIDRLADAAAR